MIKNFRNVAIVASLSTAAYAAPFLAIGDNAELFLTGTLGVRFDDNVLLTKNNESDTVFEFAPGFSLEFGKNALTKGALTYTETISRFMDNDDLDTELSDVAFRTNYDDSKLKLKFDTRFSQLAQNTRDTRVPVGATGRAALNRRDVFNIGGGGEVNVSEKTSVGAGGRFTSTDYKRPGFVDSDEFSVPVNVYYELTPKVDLSAGLRYRSTDLASGGNDSEDYYYNVGARGEFTPKLSGEFSVGYNQRDVDGGGDKSSLGLDSTFTYLYSEKTSFRAALSNDFGVDAAGESQENSILSLGVDSAIAPDLKVGAGITYRRIDYVFADYEDDYIEGNLRATYIVNEYFNLFGGYTYRDNDGGREFTSVADNPSFTNHVFSFGTQIRY
ncbi:MAG TPA: outer membrane beta-barrel protein [Opitutaceae bacterium]